jgi:hypothetical protein
MNLVSNKTRGWCIIITLCGLAIYIEKTSYVQAKEELWKPQMQNIYNLH